MINFMSKNYYTYAYLREDRTPYYIGRGSGRRAFSKNHTVPLPPKERVLFLKTGLTFAESVQHEIYMIAVFGRKDNSTGILRNLTDGGEGIQGFKHSPKGRERISQGRTGMTFTLQHRKNLSLAHSGLKQPESQIVKRMESLPRGENHHKWKLSVEDRKEISRRYIPRSPEGNGNTQELADEFDTTPQSIRRIAKDPRWTS